MIDDDEEVCPRCGEPLDYIEEDDPEYDPDEAVDPYFDVHERCVTEAEHRQRMEVLAKMLRDKGAETE